MTLGWQDRFVAALARLESALTRPVDAQEALLLRLLRRADRTRWGELHHTSTIRTLREYQASVPLGSHEDHAPFIQRAANGEPDVLFPGKATFIAKTSGTSGQPKLVAFPADVEDELVALTGPMMAARLPECPGYLDCSLFVSGKYEEGVSEGGITTGSASGFFRRFFSPLPLFQSVPEPIFEETDHELRYYALLLYSLAQPIRLLQSLNPSTLITLFEKALHYADALAADLRDGRLRRGPGACDALARQCPPFSPAPEVAVRLLSTLGNHGRFIATEVWPQLRAVAVWRGGDAALYIPKLLESCPGVQLWPMQYSSSEAAVAVPLDRNWIGGVPVLCGTVLEFFPAQDLVSNADCIPMQELVLGQGYRVAVTNSRGFYRYLMDDVSIVDGYYKGAPILRFSHRLGGTSSLTGEKLMPQQVRDAVAAASSYSSIRRFTMAPRWDSPPRYVLFLEPDGPRLSTEAYRLMQQELDATLRRLNIEYDAKRSSLRLAMLELAIVTGAYFDKLREKTLGGRSDAQYKLQPLSREVAAWPPEGLIEHVTGDSSQPAP